MNTAARTGRVRVAPRRDWPARLVLRRRLALARVRPWNRHHDDASLRLERGGRAFLADCVAELKHLGAPGVFSPPLPATTAHPWKAAGFVAHTELALLKLDLTTPLPRQEIPVRRSDELAVAAAIDEAAFDDFWVLDTVGLEEAKAATRRSELLLVGTPAVGFAIVGYGTSFSYLQRVAVDPRHQRRGVGTALLTEAARRARRRGARTMFLNTQQDNDASLELYRRLGFERSEEELLLLRA